MIPRVKKAHQIGRPLRSGRPLPNAGPRRYSGHVHGPWAVGSRDQPLFVWQQYAGLLPSPRFESMGSQQAEAGMESPTRILVVDDEATITEFISELFIEDGQEVIRISEPESALSELQTAAFDLLITDLRMPGMSGHELIQRAREIQPGLPVVIITGNGTMESAVKALRQGVDDFLTKPFDIETLERVIHRVLKARGLETENRRLVGELKKVNQALRSHRDLLQHEIADATRDLERTNIDLKDHIRDLSLHQRIYRIGTSTDELPTLLNESLDIICRALGAELGSIMLKEDDDDLKVVATYGERHEPIRDLRRPRVGGIVGLVTDKGRVLRDDSRSQVLLSRRRKYRTRHFLSAPLLVGAKSVGVINISDPVSRHPFSRKSAKVLSSTAEEVGLLVDRIKGVQARQISYVSTIKTLVDTLEAKAPYFRGHSERVATISLELAQKVRLSDADCRLLGHASYLHDVGKIGIPDRILHSHKKLTEEEMDVIREHPAIGADLIRHFDFLEDTRPLIRHHHERWDGKGYPDGLIGDRIPYLASFITIADSWDAMLSARPYRKELTRDVARREILKGAGTQFHPELALSFCGRSTPITGNPAGRVVLPGALGQAKSDFQEELRRVEQGRTRGSSSNRNGPNTRTDM